jgi:hypothetical protein
MAIGHDQGTKAELRRILGGRHPLLGAAIALVAALAVIGVLILDEDDPPAEADPLVDECQKTAPGVVCTFETSAKLNFGAVLGGVEGALNKDLDPTTPVRIQAWGGRGAKGASSGSVAGAFGGYAGYAISVSSVRDLSDGFGLLFLYVGADGSKHPNYSGQGAASTVVSTSPLSQISGTDKVLVIAGGSGGGGRACKNSGGGRGGDGGVAIGAGQTSSGGSGSGPHEGTGGNGGTGGAGGTGAGAGGNGLGGYGGRGNSSGSLVGWIGVDEVDAGADGLPTGGGGQSGGGGGGGGGYGGGGGGGANCVGGATRAQNGGGGGGGSYAREDTIVGSGAPTGSQQADGVSSKVIVTFDAG